VLRGTGDIQQVSLDDVKRTVTVEGAAGQIAMAAWLVRQMDLSPNGEFSGLHEYRPPAGNDGVVRMFYLTHASTARQCRRS